MIPTIPRPSSACSDHGSYTRYTSPIGSLGRTNPSTATATCTRANATQSTARLDTLPILGGGVRAGRMPQPGPSGDRERFGHRPRQRLGDVERGDRAAAARRDWRASPARPCSHTAAAATRASPCSSIAGSSAAAPATSAPIAPASTSPVPAVASHGVPDSTAVAQPCGSATIVRAPLSTTTAPSAAAVSRAACTRSAPDGARPSSWRRRSCSRSCGVTMRRAVAPTASASAPASTTTGRSPARRSRSALVSAAGRVAASVPDPISHACTRPSTVTVSGRRWSTRSRAAPRYRTMPRPVRHAASTPSTAAPGYSADPVRIPSTPREYLSSAAVGFRRARAVSSGIHNPAMARP